MQSVPIQAADLPDRRLPAWLFSLAFHVGLIVLMCAALEGVPQGASGEIGRSAGIVLKRASSTGTQYEGESDTPEPTAVAESSSRHETVSIQSDEGRAAAPQATTASAPVAAQGDQQGSASQPNSVEQGQGASEGDSYADVSVFGVQGTGNKFVYVFDRSSSMEGPPLAAAKRQLVESLKSLEAVHQFHIIFFNHRLRLFDITSGGRRVAFGTERNKKLAANFVGGISADGGTDRFTALKQALAFRPDVIFFLTDADDPMSACEMAEIERLYTRVGATICVIEFGRAAVQPKENFLTELARKSGGQYGYVNTAKLAR